MDTFRGITCLSGMKQQSPDSVRMNRFSVQPFTGICMLGVEKRFTIVHSGVTDLRPRGWKLTTNSLQTLDLLYIYIYSYREREAVSHTKS